MIQAEVLRAALTGGPTLLVPGIYDCLTALLAESAGFRAVFLGGNAATAALRGLPDLGFLSSTELSQLVRNICGILKIPLIVDADTGFGGPLQVHKTFRELEQARACARLQAFQRKSPRNDLGPDPRFPIP